MTQDEIRALLLSHGADRSRGVERRLRIQLGLPPVEDGKYLVDERIERDRLDKE